MKEKVIEQLLTICDWVRWGASRFTEADIWFGHGTDNALDESLLLVLHSLHLDHDVPTAYLNARLTEDEREQVYVLLKRRIDERQPAAYLTHHARFFDLDFYVNSDVLVPRSPIAELIEQQFSPWLDPDNVATVLDLCTGSGCIAIACAVAFPDAQVDASDISNKALAVAHINVEKHGLQDRVRLYPSNLFDDLPVQEPMKQYDLIISNPPYVSHHEMTTLPGEYHQEPRLGLAAGKDGLEFARRILVQASQFLKPDGIIVVEVGSSAHALQETFPDVPFLWFDFERGGEGVFMLTAEQLNHIK